MIVRFFQFLLALVNKHNSYMAIHSIRTFSFVSSAAQSQCLRLRIMFSSAVDLLSRKMTRANSLLYSTSGTSRSHSVPSVLSYCEPWFRRRPNNFCEHGKYTKYSTSTFMYANESSHKVYGDARSEVILPFLVF